MTPSALRHALDDTAVAAAIAEAESRTSGEIRVLLSNHAAPNPLEAAAFHFDRLKMRTTRERNAVLIFLAPKSQTLAFFGDAGIHARLGPEPWQGLVADLTAAFKAGDWTPGLTTAIRKLGTLLATHFPANTTDNPDELPNAVERDH